MYFFIYYILYDRSLVLTFPAEEQPKEIDHVVFPLALGSVVFCVKTDPSLRGSCGME